MTPSRLFIKGSRCWHPCPQGIQVPSKFRTRDSAVWEVTDFLIFDSGASYRQRRLHLTLTGDGREPVNREEDVSLNCLDHFNENWSPYLV